MPNQRQKSSFGNTFLQATHFEHPRCTSPLHCNACTCSPAQPRWPTFVLNNTHAADTPRRPRKFRHAPSPLLCNGSTFGDHQRWPPTSNPKSTHAAAPPRSQRWFSHLPSSQCPDVQPLRLRTRDTPDVDFNERNSFIYKLFGPQKHCQHAILNRCMTAARLHHACTLPARMRSLDAAAVVCFADA